MTKATRIFRLPKCDWCIHGTIMVRWCFVTKPSDDSGNKNELMRVCRRCRQEGKEGQLMIGWSFARLLNKPPKIYTRYHIIDRGSTP